MSSGKDKDTKHTGGAGAPKGESGSAPPEASSLQHGKNPFLADISLALTGVSTAGWHHKQDDSGALDITNDGISFPLVSGTVKGDEAKHLHLVVGSKTDTNKVIILANDLFLSHQDGWGYADNNQLHTSMLTWLSMGLDHHPAKLGIVGFPGLKARLGEIGISAEDTEPSGMTTYDVVYCNGDLSPKDLGEVGKFLSTSGKGLIIATHGKRWHDKNPTKTMADFPGNQLLKKFGVEWTTQSLNVTVSAAGGQGWLVADRGTKL